MTKAIERETVKVTTVLGDGLAEGFTTNHEGVAVVTGVLVENSEQQGIHVVMQGNTNFNELLNVTETIVENVISSAIDDRAGHLPEALKISLKLTLLEKLTENIIDRIVENKE